MIVKVTTGDSEGWADTLLMPMNFTSNPKAGDPFHVRVSECEVAGRGWTLASDRARYKLQVCGWLCVILGRYLGYLSIIWPNTPPPHQATVNTTRACCCWRDVKTDQTMRLKFSRHLPGSSSSAEHSDRERARFQDQCASLPCDHSGHLCS